MRKVISFFIAVVLLTMLFSSCSYSNDESQAENNQNQVNSSVVQLNTNNATDYLTFNLQGGGTDSYYSEVWGTLYKSAFFSGTVSGISGYSYNNVTIEITCSYNYTDYKSSGTFTLSDTTSLNIGGNGSVASSKSSQMLTGNGALRKIECTGYSITSITGTVTKN